jgi:CHAT domain-containing protein
MGDRILVKIQKNFEAGPTMMLLSPHTHGEAATGYDLHFSGMEFTADPATQWLTIVGHNVLEKNARVWVANSGGKLPAGLVPRNDYYISDLSGQQVRLAENRKLSAPAAFTDTGAGSHFFLTWPAAPPFHKLMNQLYKPRTVEEAGTLLAEALSFHPAIRDALDHFVQPAQKERVPIYIEVGPADADALPWEALYKQGAGFLGLDPRWPIARVLARDSVEIGYCPPLKMMAVLSAPTLAEGAGGEWDAIYSALTGSGLEYDLLAFVSEAALLAKIKSLGDSKVTVIELTDENEILEAITDFQPDLLHFYCHGFADGPAQLIINAAFDLENGLEPSIRIKAEKLWQSADLTNPPWLLTLNCCESAAPRSSETLNLASYLGKMTFPSVIGMRQRVASDYANHFSRFLYHRIFDELYKASQQETYEIEWAAVLWKARQELATKFAGPSQTYSQVAPFCNEWTVPVLYTVRDPLNLRKLKKANERTKATRQALVRICAAFRARGDSNSLKIVDELIKKIADIDAELQPGPGA